MILLALAFGIAALPIVLCSPRLVSASPTNVRMRDSHRGNT